MVNKAITGDSGRDDPLSSPSFLSHLYFGGPVNIDFTNQPLFSWYVVLLLVSGLVLIGMGIAPTGRAGKRVFNAVVGAAFLCYGFYLGFIFEGGTYVIFFKVFFVPVALIANTVRSYASWRNAPNANAQYQAMAQAQAPYGQPQTPYGQSQTPYGQPQAPYAQQQAPYGQPQAPFAQPQAPAGQVGDPQA